MATAKHRQSSHHKKQQKCSVTKKKKHQKRKHKTKRGAAVKKRQCKRPAVTKRAPVSPPAPAATPTATAAATGTLLSETFDGANAPFATSSAFWARTDLAQNPNWFAESGGMYRRYTVGHVADGTFRMWTRRTDLGNYRVEMVMRLNGLPNLRGSTAGWDGVKFWLRRKLCTPEPGCGRVKDPNSQAGYTAEVALRDGRVYIQKKVGSNYYLLSATPSYPFPMKSWTRVGGTVRTNADGSVTIQVLRNGQVLAEVTDRGQKGGAPLRAAGRLGLRSDNADMDVDNLTISSL